MLPPRELKNKAFSKAVRGYSVAEVDEHIDFIIEKYTEMYRTNDELERRLKLALAQLDDYKKDENSIRTALIDAQKASAKIISEANERAELVARSTKESCDKAIAELRDEIKAERDKLYRIQRMVSNFKSKIFLEYQSHIQNIEKIAPDINANGEWDMSDEDYVRRIVDDVKKNMASVSSVASEEAEISSEEIQGFIAGGIETEMPKIESFLSRDFDPMSAEKDVTEFNVDAAIESYNSEHFEFAEDLPITEEELSGSDLFGEDSPMIFGDNSSPFEDDESLSIFGGKNDFDVSSDTIELERIPVTTPKYDFQSSGVKDTIKALNKKFVEENDDGIVIENFSEIQDDADREFLNMLRSATENASKREAEGRSPQVKKRTKPMSFTDEFNLVYGSNKNKK